MTLHKGAFIGKLKATVREVQDASPQFVNELVEPPAVADEGNVIYQIEAVSTAHEIDYDTVFILAKKIR